MAAEARAPRIIDESTGPDVSRATHSVIRVRSIATKPGGIEMPGQGVQTFIATKRAENRPMLGAPMELDMQLNTILGGVVIRYTWREKKQCILVPLGHLQRVELEE